MKVTESRKVAPELARMRYPCTLRRARQRFERAYVADVMRLVEHDRQLACEILGVSLSSLKEKLRPDFGR